LHRTFIHTGAAVDAGVFVNLCFLGDFDCLNRTSRCARGTAGTGFLIYFYCHNGLPR
jgi:hypothetical protein